MAGLHFTPSYLPKVRGSDWKEWRLPKKLQDIVSTSVSLLKKRFPISAALTISSSSSVSDVWLLRTTDVDSKNYYHGKPSNMSLRYILRNKVNLDSLINSLL